MTGSAPTNNPTTSPWCWREDNNRNLGVRHEPGGDSRPRLSSGATLRSVWLTGKTAELRSTGQLRAAVPTWFVVPFLFCLRYFRQNDHSGSHLLRLLHASDNQQSFRQHDQPAVIHGGLGRVLVDGFPLASAQIEGESHRRRLRRHSVVSDAVKVVRIIGPTGEVNLLVFFRASRCDAVARGSRMGR